LKSKRLLQLLFAVLQDGGVGGKRSGCEDVWRTGRDAKDKTCVRTDGKISGEEDGRENEDRRSTGIAAFLAQS